MKSLTPCITNANASTSGAATFINPSWYPRIKHSQSADSANSSEHLHLRPRQTTTSHADPLEIIPALPTRPARRTTSNRGSILAPLTLFAGLAAVAYLVAGQSITAFHNSWQQTDTGYSTNGTQLTASYDFQNAAIPGPFAKVSASWDSLKQHLPLFAAAKPSATTEAQ